MWAICKRYSIISDGGESAFFIFFRYNSKQNNLSVFCVFSEKLCISIFWYIILWLYK